MANVCVIDRGDDKNGYIQALPDCPHSPSTPGPYNIMPMEICFGTGAFVVLCIFIAVMYFIRRQSKVEISEAMVKAKVPDLIADNADLRKRLSAIEKNNLDPRVRKIEQYVGGSIP